MSRYDCMRPIPVSPWRWVALGAVIAGFFHERLHGWTAGPLWQTQVEGHISSIGPGASVLDASRLMQLMLVWYGLAQLSELQRGNAAHDRVSRWVVLIALLAAVRLTTSVDHNLWLSAAVSIGLVAASAVAYLRIRLEIVDGRASGWIGVPFSLWLGWTSIVAAASLLAAAGVSNPAPAVTLIAFIAGAAMYLGLQLRDFVLPGFVAWAMVKMSATGRLAPPTETSALLAGGLCAVVAIVIAATRFSRSPQAASPSPSRRSPRA